MSGNWIGVLLKDGKRAAINKDKINAIEEASDSTIVFLSGYTLCIPTPFDQVLDVWDINVPKPVRLDQVVPSGASPCHQ